MTRSSPFAPRRKPLAMSVAALLAVAPVLGAASTWTVTSCDEDSTGDIATKTGTLRFATDNAGDGDDVDMTALACSTISLKSGAIQIKQDNLVLAGPGAKSLQIDASSLPQTPGDYRALNHYGTGKLTIKDVSVTGGHVLHVGYDAIGGCIFSGGSVALFDVNVSSCSAGTLGNYVAAGGGIYSKGGLALYYSTLSDNTASSASGFVQGGGARTPGDFSAKYSTIHGNHASGVSSAFGGGVSADGNVTIAASTVSGNSSDGNIGGVAAANDALYALNTLTIANSTISGNYAAKLMGGVYADSGTVAIYNSTIAFNSAGDGKNGDYFAPGVGLAIKTPYALVTLQSSILAHNTYGSIEDDISMAQGSVTIAGSLNLVRAATAKVPDDTSHECPLLAPLRDNGGLTQTHALASGSPAIDAGDDDKISYDQRGMAKINGVADFLRLSGKYADIGAYEVQQDEIVFNGSFEGCP